MDHDIAYVLGLISACGEFHVQNDIRRINLFFPFNLLEVVATPDSPPIDQQTAINLRILDAIERLNDLVENNEGMMF